MDLITNFYHNFLIINRLFLQLFSSTYFFEGVFNVWPLHYTSYQFEKQTENKFPINSQFIERSPWCFQTFSLKKEWRNYKEIQIIRYCKPHIKELLTLSALGSKAIISENERNSLMMTFEPRALYLMWFLHATYSNKEFEFLPKFSIPLF